MRTPKKYTTDFVTSKDGTRIHFRKWGTGEGLVLVHGAMMNSEDFMQLGELMSDKFTVYIPDRAGRGLSEEHMEYSLQKEVEDIQALLSKTNTTNIFGLSSGAVITLQTALSYPKLKQMAIYEPPLLTAKSMPFLNKLKEDYQNAMSKQQYTKAFVSIIKHTGDEGAFVKSIPDFILVPLMKMYIKIQSVKRAGNNEESLLSRISAMNYDLRLISQSTEIMNQLNKIKVGILLLGGDKSVIFLREILNEISLFLPEAKKKILPKAGHSEALNEGKPEIIAGELKAFFK